MTKNERSGFTLIEMLVVVAIIGLLSSVVVVGVGSARKQARDAKRISDIRQIQNLLENAYMTVSPPAYPAALPSGSPSDPLSGAYGYLQKTGGDGYYLGACLEGSRPEGASHVRVPATTFKAKRGTTECACDAAGNPSPAAFCVET